MVKSKGRRSKSTKSKERKVKTKSKGKAKSKSSFKKILVKKKDEYLSTDLSDNEETPIK